MNIYKIITLFSIVVVSFQSALAQGFEVSPVILEFNAEPATSMTKTVTISNYFNQRRAFNLTLGDFDRNQKGEKAYSKAGQMKRSCADWITISPSFVEVNPNESKDITVTMNVPSGKKETRWSMIYVKAAKEQTSFNADKGFAGGVVVSPTIGIQVYQSPKSNTNYKAALSNLRELTEATDKDRKLSVFVENLGDKNLKCKMYLLIANLETATEEKTSTIVFPLLPGRSREAELKLPKKLAKGKYSIAAILDYGHGSDLEGIQTEIEIR